MAKIQGRETIWIHSVSVGETRAAVPLIRALRQEYPEACLLVTTVTETGQDAAGKIKEADLCLYFPFDLFWVVRRALAAIKPKAIIIVETEIWPNLVRLASDVGIPLVLVNGRLSDRSFPRYKAGKFFVQQILDKFSAFCMQSELDGQRVQWIGALREKVTITGNLKFDSKTITYTQEDTDRIREELKIPQGMPVWVAGSTHEGEEEDLIRVYIRLLKDWPDLILILVPRHPNRCGSVGDMIRSHGFSYSLRSQGGLEIKPGANGKVFLVDTMGEMFKMYSLADIVFVGGSLVPVGGHNILEASMVKKAVVFGPFMNNFKHISKLLQKANAGICVQDKEELFHCLDKLLRSPELRQSLGNNGFHLLEKNKGATEKTLNVLKTILRS
ncbi:MAG: 3-deoxy-D-manno-octulosonic acid transferase [Deltaproteobacteria bacterium]|nr:3-deoxy-D-manno-octulosonic acid transferase [Deltaproteobacteria bacterium]